MSFEKPKPKTSCARCASPEHAGDVWGVPVCHSCNAAWHRDESFSSAAINAALGQPDDPTLIVDVEAHHRAYCTEATRRTKAWVSSKARAA
jgi:hypothetical protein